MISSEQAVLTEVSEGKDFINITGGVNIVNEIFNFNTKECTGVLYNKKIKELYSINEPVRIESDTYQLISDNFFVKFGDKVSDCKLTINNQVDVFNKFNASKFSGGELSAIILNNKMKNIQLKNRIKGIIISEKKKG